MMNSGPLQIQLTNALNGCPYRLVRAHEIICDDAQIARIVSICNEPEVYAWLFRGPLDGKAYESAKARDWLNWAAAGWAAGSHFVFAVIDEHQHIAAACDIKSRDAVAEIGYWASRHHRGIMTNAVRAVGNWAQEAGFHGLFARTKLANHASHAVLARTGFRQVASEKKAYHRFELSLGR